MFNSFYEKDTYKTKIDSSVNSFYRLLDVVYQSGDDILKKLNEIVQFETNEQRKEIFFDSTTVYFESFEAQGLKHQGYSKDGKFKENQIVIGLACDKNGIPFHIKIFHGRTPDQNTFIPFILEIEKKYNIKNITVVADRGMSSARNIRFLEQKGYKFIISYRAKNTSRAFKEYVLNESDYVEINQTLKYKFNDIFSTYKNKRQNSNLRRRVITHSTIRAKKDKVERENIIKSFQNKLDKNGYCAPKKTASRMRS
ncbi:IS1634 family transposase, partial [Rhizobium sp. KAs_5_22]